MGSYCVKINKSLLTSGKITLPNDAVKTLMDVSNWEVGQSKDIKLIFKDKEYLGKFAFKVRNARNSSNGGKPYYQISYNIELTKALKKEFIHTYLSLAAERISHEQKLKYHRSSDEVNREVLQLKSNRDNIIYLSTFLKLNTEYDLIFEQMIERNMLYLFENEKEKSANEDIIEYSSKWISKDELYLHKDVSNAVYYLVDTINKEIYIGYCSNLGNRVKSNRKEIPNWDMFKYETIKPEYINIKGKIESHAIRAFASFLENGANEPFLKISEFKLKNKAWAKRK